jgi:hypothetical protein
LPFTFTLIAIQHGSLRSINMMDFFKQQKFFIPGMEDYFASS